MSGIGIITNPHSKLNKRNPGRSALLGYILGEKGRLEVTNNLEDLERVAAEFKSKEISILAINGGDGTICRTLTAFIKVYAGVSLPKVALLRGGTINVLANNLGIKGSPEQILYRLVEVYSNVDKDFLTQTLTTLEVEGSYGFLFGNGAASSFLKEYYKRKSGPLGAFMWTLAVWFSGMWNGNLYRSVIKNQMQNLLPEASPAFSHSSLAVFASTLKNMPLGYPLFRSVQLGGDAFQCVSFTLDAKDAVWKLPGTMVKLHQDNNNNKLSFTTSSLGIETDSGAFEYTLDGELYTSSGNRLDIRMGPKIEFIRI